LKKERVEEILESHGVIEVTYRNNPVWLESISNDMDNFIQVKDLKTDRHFFVNIEDLKE
jgi:small acid-soluble spore protein H (minor)